MRKLNFLMLAFTLLLGITMTSCLGSDDTEYTRQALVRCKTGYLGSGYFEDPYGIKLYPSSESLLKVEASGSFRMSSTNLAMIAYNLIETESTSNSATTKEYNIELLDAASFDGPAVVVANTAADMATMAPETASITTIKSSSYSWVPYIYDKETLFIPIVFRWSGETSLATQHKLVLACNLEDVAPGSKELTFYLRHDRGTDEKTSQATGTLKGYDIRQAVSRFKMIAGNDPETIAIYTKETGDFVTTEPTELTKYTAKFDAKNDSEKIFNVTQSH